MGGVIQSLVGGGRGEDAYTPKNTVTEQLLNSFFGHYQHEIMKFTTLRQFTDRNIL